MSVDPRWYQIVVLGTLLTYGLFGLSFEVLPANAIAIAVTAQLTQALGDHLSGRRYDFRSPLITTLSLCLLLRTNAIWVAAFAAAVAIGSKYVARVGGKHLFNPAMIGIVAAVAATGQAWISPGQWGNAALAALLFACAGSTVVVRAVRADVTYTFLGVYSGLLLWRSWHLGEPVAIPLHRLQSGALLLFAFFMISDPKTTPDARWARIVHAIAVAVGAYTVQFVWFRANGLVWSLLACSILVPILDHLAPATRYSWARPTAGERRVVLSPPRRELRAELLAYEPVQTSVNHS